MSEQIANMLSASNEWPQSYHQIKEGDQDDEHQIRSMNNNNNNKMTMAAKEGGGGEGTRVVMEKPSQEQIQHQQQPLKCPRCDSTNTKFCYYNNYSLSQPRHFCKACKRYWTRGGTLRTVPVGGGCRKNKRIRRISTNNPTTSAPTNSSSNNSSSIISESNTFNSHQSLNPSGSGAHLMSPLLYGLPTNLAHHHASPHEAIINGFPFSSSYDNTHHHHQHQHQQHQLGGIGLGFSSAGMILGGGDHRNGYSTTPKQILHDLISNSNPSSLLSNFHGSNSNTASTNTTTTTLPTMSMSSLLTSTLHQHQHKFNFDTLFPYELDLHIKGVGSHENEGVYMKEDSVKLEGDYHPHRQCQIQIQNGYHQIHDNHHHQQQSMGESDPSILWNANNSNGNSIGVNWLDPNCSNLGSSSVPSLI